MNAHDWVETREDAEQAEYLRAWRRRRGCLHWLMALGVAWGLSLR